MLSDLCLRVEGDYHMNGCLRSKSKWGQWNGVDCDLGMEANCDLYVCVCICVYMCVYMYM